MNSINEVETMPKIEDFESQKRRSSRTQPKTRHPDPITCPRCESTNTKFCYYNNYNKTQPRYFCKACKRHWTKGGILRNVPVGGGRKNNRIRRPVMTATTTAATTDQETYDRESQSSFFTPISNEKEDTESYTDIEELKGFVSWDFYETFEGWTMSEFVHEDLSFSRFSSSFDANPSSSTRRSFIRMVQNDDDSTTATSMIMSSSQQTSNLSWNDLNTMVLEDLNQPWEDPTFKS